jgi:hypothetical protein
MRRESEETGESQKPEIKQKYNAKEVNNYFNNFYSKYRFK